MNGWRRDEQDLRLRVHLAHVCHHRLQVIFILLDGHCAVCRVESEGRKQKREIGRSHQI